MGEIGLGLRRAHVARSHRPHDPLVDRVAARQGGAGVYQHVIVGVFRGVDRHGGHRKGLGHPALLDVAPVVGLEILAANVLRVGKLHAPHPVVGRDLLVALDDVARHVELAEFLFRGGLRPRLRLEDAVADGPVHGRAGAGLEVVVDRVDATGAVPAVGGAMPPVEDHVVDVVEISPHAHARITAGVVGPKISHERAVGAADRRTEGVVKGVEPLGEDALLDRDVDGGEFEILGAIRRVIHVAIHAHVFVEAPAG